jgi:hypothetical protein
MSLNESSQSGSGLGGGHGSHGGHSGGGQQAAGGSQKASQSHDGAGGSGIGSGNTAASSVTTTKKSNWEVIEHYKASGAPASLMATTTHQGVGRNDSSRGESSHAQNSCTGGDGDPDSDTTEIESVMRDHSDDWWNIFSLCGRVFRYVFATLLASLPSECDPSSRRCHRALFAPCKNYVH